MVYHQQLENKLGSNISAGNSQGFNLSSSTASGSVAYVKAINAVSNPDDFDINLVSAPVLLEDYTRMCLIKSLIW